MLLEEVSYQDTLTSSEAILQVTTEKMVRKQVQSVLGVDVSHKKAFIKEQVSLFRDLEWADQIGILLSWYVEPLNLH